MKRDLKITETNPTGSKSLAKPHIKTSENNRKLYEGSCDPGLEAVRLILQAQ